jgi:diadenosine tetraphosphate (Ap4A) HIT family hydrolase
MSCIPGCPFCEVPDSAVLRSTTHALAIRDRFPVAPGHVLVVPRRHVASVFELSLDEWHDLWALVRDVRRSVTEFHDADGSNVGVNDGTAAGQTVEHAHVHLIPRREGDVEDPRGGVRWVVPSRADYWSTRDA